MKSIHKTEELERNRILMFTALSLFFLTSNTYLFIYISSTRVAFRRERITRLI